MSETRRRTNLSDIAAAAGVDASTVSLALNSSPRIAGKTREKILRIARKLNYSPNFLARGLTGQKTRSVGLLVSTFQDQFYVELVAALERWLRQRGYSCLLSTVATEEGQNEIQAIRDLFNRFVDGVACAGIGNQNAMQEELAALAGQGMPLVGFGELLDAPALRSAPMDRVTCPLGQSCAEMTRHLLDLGHRRIAFVGMGPHKISGYSEALRERGIPLDPSLVVSLAYHFQDVNELRKEMMSRRDRPTAIFAYTDDLAAELVMELQEAGYRIPEDVSIASINDTWHSRMLRVPLTTLRLPIRRIAETMAEMLLERIETPSLEGRVQELPVELVVRESTGAVPGASRSDDGMG